MSSRHPRGESGGKGSSPDARYRIERVLGRGGMATVYAAFDRNAGRYVALKRLGSSSPRTLSLFEQEYQTLASLRHPGIVQVYDYVRDEAGPFYTMELLRGSDLSSKAPMPWQDVCVCLRDAAAILGVLHVRQLVYRDLSPKNLWLSPDGRLKILDFGALASFGVARELAGTPPLIAPEAFQGAALDAKTDLFSLGALGFWLLTGDYPYAGRTTGEVLLLHKGPPITPGSIERVLTRKGMDAVPFALLEVLASLLRTEPRERLAATSELVDRLCTVADLEPEVHQVAASGYVQSKPLVGREHELAAITRAVADSEQGTTQVLIIDGAPGSGRTHIAREVAVLARLKGSFCITAEATPGTPPFGLARALVQNALREMPGFGKHAMHHESWHVLAQVGPYATALSRDGRPTDSVVELWLDLWSRRADIGSIALIIDRLDCADLPSRQLLSALTERTDSARLLIAITTGNTDRGALHLKARSVSRVHLLPFSVDNTSQLLRSMFGNHSQLDRIASWIHRATLGNPALTVQHIERLVESEVIHYRDGLWVLPREVELARVSDLLPPDGSEGSHLSGPARALARRLSIPRFRDLTRQDCIDLSEIDVGTMDALLLELQGAGVLVAPAHEGRFIHDGLRKQLLDELSMEERRRLHAKLADAQAARPDAGADTLIHASNHFLHANQPVRANALWKTVMRQDIGTPDFLRSVAPVLEDCYVRLVEAQADETQTVIPLAALAIAGYLVDRRYAVSYGDKAIESIGRVLRVHLARRLTPYLGRLLALLVALAVAAVALAPKRTAPALRDVLTLYLAACSALSGVAATFVDADSAARYAFAAQPFAALGSRTAPWLVYAFAKTVTLMVSDRRALAQQQAQALLERISRPGPIRGLREDQRAQYRSALLFCLGVNARFRDDAEVLDIADRLEQLDPSAARNANHLRASYFLSQAKHAEANECLRRVEVQTVQLGTAWQSELWLPADAISIAMRLEDALMMKRAARELARVAVDVPSFTANAQQARGTYLVMRGKYSQAIPLLETDEEPLARMGWLRARAMLARAHNGLADHRRAREVGLEALRHLQNEDRRYVRMGSLHAAIEVALADAALGRADEAKMRLEELLAFHASQNAALTLGAIHEASAKVAANAGRRDDCLRHFVEFDQLVRPTGIPAWIDRIEALGETILLAGGSPNQLPGDSAYPPTPRERLPPEFRALLREEPNLPVAERAERLTRAAMKHCRADHGYLFLLGQEPSWTHVGDEPAPEVVAWAKQRLAASDLDEADTEVGHEDGGGFTYFGEHDANVLTHGARRYAFTPLWVNAGSEDSLLGALVLGAADAVPRLDFIVARAVAAHLPKDLTLANKV